VNRLQGRVGRPKGLRLTETDHQVLRQIGQEQFLSYPELRKEVLSRYSRQHSWAIPKRLVKMGYLNESKGDQGHILGWSLTPQARALLEGKLLEEVKLCSKPPSYRTAYHHDVTLREIKSIFTRSPKIQHWVPEHILKSKAKQTYHSLTDQEKRTRLLAVPDGMFQFCSAEQTLTAAVELELTRKSSQRIMQRFEAHLLNPEFDFAFFIVGDVSLLGILWNLYQKVLDQSPMLQVQSRRNGMYFTLLEMFLKERLKANFIGLHDTYSFEERDAQSEELDQTLSDETLNHSLLKNALSH